MKRFLFGLGFVALIIGLHSLWARKTRSQVFLPAGPDSPSHEEIARRAYFIGKEHDARGEKPDPQRDWVEAEQELFV